MMFTYLFVFFVPALVYARIAIKIIAGKTEAATSVHFTGSETAIISDQERESFQITEWDLLTACQKYAGTRPSSVYVKSPTPWADVYHKFNWPQVQRILKPVRSRIMGINTQPIIISTRELENYSRVKAKFNAAISHSTEETVSNSWSKGGELTIGQEITYNVNFASGSVGGSTSLSYASNWGNETSKATTITLGSTSSVEVELEPGHAVIATLTATRGTLDIEVDYEAHLTGRVFANYGRKFRGHNWWAFLIDQVMEAARIPKYVKSTETISIGFYTSARVEVSDSETSQTMTSVPAGIIGPTKNKKPSIKKPKKKIK